MNRINKLSFPATLLIMSLVLGGFYYVTQMNKQKYIERQKQLEMGAKSAVELMEKVEKENESGQRERCVLQAKIQAAGACQNCKEGDYHIVDYDHYNKMCLQERGLN